MWIKTATELARWIRERRLGVEELAKAYLDRIENVDGPDGLNTIAELNAKILDEARHMDARTSDRGGALFGLLLLVKDNIDVAGLHTTAGSLALADNLPARDARVVANLRRNGALILGKTNMTEFANYTGQDMPGGYSSRGGQVRHAYDRGKNPSGSSSGSAVAVSAGLCAAALGTDTSFSIVGCAAENGVTGLKPACGSLSQQGIVPIAHTFDSAGPITRDLSDALLVYSSMRDAAFRPVRPMSPESLHLAINIFRQDQVSDAQRARYEVLLDSLKSDGVRVTEVTHAVPEHYKDICRCEFRKDLECYLGDSGAGLRTLREVVGFYEARPEQMMKYGIAYLRDALDKASGQLDDAVYLEALEERRRLREHLLESLRGVDACLMTGPTNIMHYVGFPSLALRLGMDADGTPRGMILYGPDERRLLGAALTIERYGAPVAMPTL